MATTSRSSPGVPTRRPCVRTACASSQAAGDLHLRPVQLHADALATGLVDIVLVAVKMYDLEAAAEIIRPLLNVDTAVVPFQNGVEATAILERKLGRRYVCGGVAYIAAGIEAPGVIRHTGTIARLLFGELHPNDSWRLDTLQAACQGAGIDATLSPAIATEIWRKFLFLAPFAASTCVGPRPDRGGPRGPVAVVTVHGAGRRGCSGGAGPGRRPARGHRRRAAWPSPTACRPRCARRCCTIWRPAGGSSWTG